MQKKTVNTQTTPHNTSSFANNVGTWVGIGYNDIEIIKQSRNKRTAIDVGNKSKTKKKPRELEK